MRIVTGIDVRVDGQLRKAGEVFETPDNMGSMIIRAGWGKEAEAPTTEEKKSAKKKKAAKQ